MTYPHSNGSRRTSFEGHFIVHSVFTFKRERFLTVKTHTAILIFIN